MEVPEVTVSTPSISQSNMPSRSFNDEMKHRPALAELMEGATWINGIVGAAVLTLKFPIFHIRYASLVLDDSLLANLDVEKSSAESSPQRDHIVHQLVAFKNSFTKHHFAIEVLDPQCRLHGTSQPIGIITLKLRLMKQTGWDIEIVNAEEINDCKNDVRAVAALIMNYLMKAAS